MAKTKKTPPNDEPAERYVIGCAVLYGAFDETIKPEHFWHELRRQAYLELTLMRVEDDDLSWGRDKSEFFQWSNGECVTRLARRLAEFPEFEGLSIPVELEKCMSQVGSDVYLGFNAGVLRRLKYRRDVMAGAERLWRAAIDRHVDEESIRELVRELKS